MKKWLRFRTCCVVVETSLTFKPYFADVNYLTHGMELKKKGDKLSITYT